MNPVERIVEQKLARLARGKAPRVLDLFSGCGGFSLGFASQGFDLLGAVEIVPDAIHTHGLNLFGGAASHQAPLDITDQNTTLDSVMAGFGQAGGASSVDVLIGGPPCQAYTRIGRAKLRDLSDDPTAHITDRRAHLYQHFLEYVRAAVPLVVLIENVYDIVNFGGRNLAQEICKALDQMGYCARYTHLNAACYGVPQFRERIFIMATHKRLGVKPVFPRPSHRAVMPQGYLDIHTAIACRTDKSCIYSEEPPAVPPDVTKPAVTAGEALAGLPPVDPIANPSRYYRPKDLWFKYPSKSPSSPYDEQMRNWRNFPSDGVRNHVTRTLRRDTLTFSHMRPGDQYPEAHRIAHSLWHSECQRLGLKPETAQSLKLLMVPPYDVRKFPNKWRKLDPSEPARTLTAHLGKDCYSHIHFDSAQGRTITVREAARLQSFPDGFVFECSMNPSFTQVGNAVPPLMSSALASAVKSLLVTASAYGPPRQLLLLN